MTILAIDPARLCGWALGSTDEGRIASGTWELVPKPKKGEKVPPDIVKMKALEAHLYESQFTHVDRIAFETPAFHAHSLALISHAKFIATMELWADKNKVETRGYEPAKIKKFATGKGNAKKPDMKKAARKKFLLTKRNVDDNECDAVAILHLALANARH